MIRTNKALSSARILARVVTMSVLWTYFSSSRISEPARLRGKAAQYLEQYGSQRLLRNFAAWKLILLLVAVASPGPGYDMSTSILFDQQRSGHDSWLAHVVEYVVLRLTRWDGIYFASASAHGKEYEQEWAFSWLMSRITSSAARGAYYSCVHTAAKQRLSTHFSSCLVAHPYFTHCHARPRWHPHISPFPSPRHISAVQLRSLHHTYLQRSP